MSKRHAIPRQNGATLVVSLVLLLIMTALALSASQMTRMQERMAANTRDRDLALQSAEAGLRTGERLVEAFISAPIPCSTPRCQVYALNVQTGDIGFAPIDTWWTPRTWRYAASNTWQDSPANAIAGNGTPTRVDPYFYVEELEEVTDTLTVPPTGPPPSRIYYRVTSMGQGGTEAAQVVLQSTFARRY